MRPEIQFLLLVCRQQTISEEQVLRLLHPEFDWNFFFRAAEKNLVIPIVYQTLASFTPGSIPEKVLEAFRIPSSKISARNLVLQRELAGILKIFQRGDIPVIPFKGPLLTQRLYQNAALRHYDDLDLLIHKKDIERTKELLFSKGYRPKKDLTGLSASQEKAYLHFHYTYDFISKDSGHQLEVHWELLPRSFSLDLDYEEIWKRCTETLFEKLTVLEFCPEDLLLILCITGAKKNWDRLLRVSDLSRALSHYPGIDWMQVAKQAQRSGAERILLLGLSLASTLFDAPVPESVLQKVKQSREVNDLSRAITDRMLESPIESTHMIQPEDQFQPLQIRMRERLSDQMRYCARFALTPSIGEWAVVTLPGPLYFLYYLLRPIRLLSKTGMRLLRLLFWPRSAPHSKRSS